MIDMSLSDKDSVKNINMLWACKWILSAWKEVQPSTIDHLLAKIGPNYHCLEPYTSDWSNNAAWQAPTQNDLRKLLQAAMKARRSYFHLYGDPPLYIGPHPE